MDANPDHAKSSATFTGLEGKRLPGKSRTPKEAHTIHFHGRLTILWEVEYQFDSEVIFRDNRKDDDPLTWPTELSFVAGSDRRTAERRRNGRGGREPKRREDLD